MKDYNFNPGWRASLAFLLSFLLFLRLGFWQLQRAGEKRWLMESRELRGQEPPLRLTGTVGEGETDFDALRFRRVVAAGEYDAAHQFLVDNQVEGQRPGYHVLTPLRFAGGGTVMVNRGWVPQGSNRSELPDLSIHQARVEIAGTVEHFQAVGLKLEGAEIPTPGWPAVVSVPEAQQLAGRLGYPVLPYQVLLDPAANEGYTRTWRQTRLDYAKNQGYALQWFLFALAAAFLYARHGLKARPGPTLR